jgi:hypothetical protein
MDMTKVTSQRDALNQRERKARVALAWAAAIVCGACWVLASTAQAAEQTKPRNLSERGVKNGAYLKTNAGVKSRSKSSSTALPLTLSASTALSSTSTKLAPNGPNAPLVAGDPLLAQPSATGAASAKEAPNACKNDGAMVCYDYRRGRAVMPGTKSLMPAVPGLKSESITLKRDKLAFNYSF